MRPKAAHRYLIPLGSVTEEQQPRRLTRRGRGTHDWALPEARTSPPRVGHSTDDSAGTSSTASVLSHLPCFWSMPDGCSCRWSLLLFLSHALVSLLTVAITIPLLDNHRLQHAGLTSPYNRALLTPLDLSQSPDVCSTSTAYPTPLPPDLSRFCNGASPLTFRYEAPRRYSKHDIAITLLTVDHYKFTRDEACMHSWLSSYRTPLAYFGVTVERPTELLQPTLVIPGTSDGYISNLNKTLLALVQLYHAHPNASWFLQSSNDAHVDLDALLLRLEPHDSEQVLYLGGSTVDGADCWLTGSKVDFFEGGSGFVLSRGWMRRYAGEVVGWINERWMSEEGRRHEETKFGDLMVGCFMKERGVQLTKLLGGHNQTPVGVTSWDEDFPVHDHRWWGWHYVQAEEQVDVDLFFRLQRIDQLERHGQWTSLLQLSRELAIDAHAQLNRSWTLLQNAIQHRDLFMPPQGQVQSKKEVDLHGVG